MARNFLTPPLPPQKKVNAHPASAIYAPGTGAGTGMAAQKMGFMNRDGSRSPVSDLGSRSGPLTQPKAGMNTAAGKFAERQLNVMRSKADGTFAFKQQTFNQANPGLHLHNDGHIAEHPDAKERLSEAGKQTGNDIPLDGKGGYANSPKSAFTSGKLPSSPSTTPQTSTAGQAESMRQSMAPASGQDRYGRTSASPSAGGMPVAPPASPSSSSARGDWQQGSTGTRFMSDQYGAGSSKNTTPERVSNVANAVSSTGGTFQKLAAGVSAATIRPSAPVLPGGVGAASTRSPTSPTSPMMAGNRATPPAYVPKPSEVPAEDLKRYADASAKIAAQDAAKAQQTAANQPALAAPTGTVKAPASQFGSTPPVSGLLSNRPMPSNFTTAPTSGTINSGNPALTPTAPKSPSSMSAASSPVPAAPSISGPSEQEIAAQQEKAAASQRGYIGNAANSIGKAAVSTILPVAGAVVSAKNDITAIPEVAGRMLDGAKKGFAQIGKDAFGSNDPTPETQKLDEMKKRASEASQQQAERLKKEEEDQPAE